MIKNDKYNNFQPGIYPYSWHSSGIAKWIGSDSPEQFKANGNPDYEYVDIDYDRNDQGFRTHELTQYEGKKVNIALGCSFTEGVGLMAHHVWPSVLEKKTDLPMLNLGLGGGSSDTVARVLSGVVSLFDIQTVYILWPPHHRFELILDWSVEAIVPGAAGMEYVWNLDDVNSYQRYCKNKLLVELLAHKYGFKVVQRDVSEYYTFIRDFARDNMHWGIETHKVIADSFINGTIAPR
jgi:hypothetical protein